MIEGELENLRFELANTLIDGEVPGHDPQVIDKIKKTITLCEYLKTQMEAETLAPKILGIELNDTLIAAIKTYLSGIIIAFIGTLWTDLTGYELSSD